MHSLGSLIRKLREEKEEPLRKTAAFLEMDPALLSKIERGQRKPSREQVEKLADYLGGDKKEFLVAWLSDRIYYEVQGESFAEEALRVAEDRIKYETKKPNKDK
ncbi:MAG TPA: transcriptional regulator [Cryomorphaceae bacterium]|nr:transcriptional regulator [Owenweeksia sp.]MBF99597.1 transcriptional regulator [Owenweeksia sp.]HAD97366.1 transcriptional regulator [Cryomorphaceae bacterium]HBF19238.1 transcriptional regulator [Cryomorphaceae bacterium]HCQ17598.1 transcriptional regulator [Cryomorphaceae bacterium]|tara:strand:+ start:267 stop:578 length:312 start_codon:yes stop_codon:yes gene_type:complete